MYLYQKSSFLANVKLSVMCCSNTRPEMWKILFLFSLCEERLSTDRWEKRALMKKGNKYYSMEKRGTNYRAEEEKRDILLILKEWLF